MNLRICICVGFLLLAGCATTPVPLSQAEPVPTSRVLAGFTQFGSPLPGRLKVAFVRDKGILGSGPSALVSIDGTAIAKLRTGEDIVVYLKPGTHIFGVTPSPRLGGALVEKSFDITQSNPRYFRISVNQSALTIQPSTQIQ